MAVPSLGATLGVAAPRAHGLCRHRRRHTRAVAGRFGLSSGASVGVTGVLGGRSSASFGLIVRTTRCFTGRGARGVAPHVIPVPKFDTG